MKPVLFSILIFLSSMLHAQNYNLLIGSYTKSAADPGVYVYNFNSQTGDLTLKSSVTGEENPVHLAVSPDKKYVFAVNEVKEGKVSSYRFNPSTGELNLVNRVSSGGASPCYVSIDDKSKYVTAGNYGSGSLSAIAFNSDGSLSDNAQVIQQEGGSIDKRRQQGPHLHCTMLSPDNKFLLTANLGNDQITTYKFNAAAASNPLSTDGVVVNAKPGSGPRYIAFHPNSKFVYVIHELSGDIVVYDYKKGKLTQKQSITVLEPGFKGRIGAADVHVSRDGRFLYGTNRGDANKILIYSIAKGGTLTYIGSHDSLGDAPRDLVFDPSDNFIIVAHQNSGDVVVLKRDQKTGMLSPTGKKVVISRATCVLFAE
jgi:6-phosphogluconolactonase